MVIIPPYESLSSVAQARRAMVVSPHNTEDLPDDFLGAVLYFNTAGTVNLVPLLGDDATPITFTVAALTILPLKVRRVLVTGTSVASIIALAN